MYEMLAQCVCLLAVSISNGMEVSVVGARVDAEWDRRRKISSKRETVIQVNDYQQLCTHKHTLPMLNILMFMLMVKHATSFAQISKINKQCRLNLTWYLIVKVEDLWYSMVYCM